MMILDEHVFDLVSHHHFIDKKKNMNRSTLASYFLTLNHDDAKKIKQDIDETVHYISGKLKGFTIVKNVIDDESVKTDILRQCSVSNSKMHSEEVNGTNTMYTVVNEYPLLLKIKDNSMDAYIILTPESKNAGVDIRYIKVN